MICQSHRCNVVQSVTYNVTYNVKHVTKRVMKRDVAHARVVCRDSSDVGYSRPVERVVSTGSYADSLYCW